MGFIIKYNKEGTMEKEKYNNMLKNIGIFMLNILIAVVGYMIISPILVKITVKRYKEMLKPKNKINND